MEPKPPPEGWTLAEAAAALLPKPYAQASQPPPANWWMAGGAEPHKRERDALRLAFARLMDAGEYAADGIALNEAEPSGIPPHLWRAATFTLGLPGEPDYPAEVMAGGRWWRGVRIAVCGAAPAPRLPDMPTRWTLLEALAWIMFRDTRTVQGASLEMPREATAYLAEARLPGGSAELTPIMGEPGYSRLRLSGEWAYHRAKGLPPPGLEPDAADRDLLAKLRSGAIFARGRQATDVTPRDMDPGDWRGLVLVEPARGEVAAEPERTTGRPWREITIARDDAVQNWPRLGDGAGNIPASAPPAAMSPVPEADTAPIERRPVYSPGAGKIWLLARVRDWPKDAPLPSAKIDLEAARKHFEGDVPRDPFRHLRGGVVPPNWRKSGPRKPP